MNMDYNGPEDPGAVGRWAARIGRALATVGVSGYTVQFGRYEDSSDLTRVAAPEGSPAGTAELLEFLGAADVARDARYRCPDNNEGSTGEIRIDFADRTVRGEVFGCEYLADNETLAEDDPDRVVYASEQHYIDSRRINRGDVVLDPADVLLAIPPDVPVPPERSVPDAGR